MPSESLVDTFVQAVRDYRSEEKSERARLAADAEGTGEAKRGQKGWKKKYAAKAAARAAVLESEGDTEALIVVHCTHGLNRTGYMICRYLMCELGMRPQSAIDAFQGARDHEIARPLYIKALYDHADDDDAASESVASGSDIDCGEKHDDTTPTASSTRDPRDAGHDGELSQYFPFKAPVPFYPEIALRAPPGHERARRK